MESRVAQPPVDRSTEVVIYGALALPLALLILLRAAPPMDAHWENNPAHFWIVFVAGAISAALAIVVTEAGRRRRDARLCLIGVAFLCSAGFLALHALATPGVLLGYKNAGFVLATPVGLIGAGFFAGLSAREYGLDASLRIVRAVPWLVALVLAAMGVWAGVSLAGLPPLKNAVTPDQVTAPLGAVAAIGVIAYAFAASMTFLSYLLLVQFRSCSMLTKTAHNAFTTTNLAAAPRLRGRESRRRTVRHSDGAVRGDQARLACDLGYEVT